MAWGRDPHDPDSRVHRPRRPRAVKDTRRWCRGKVGREHQPHIVFRPYDDSPLRACKWRPGWAAGWSEAAWWCNHREECAVCGKVLRRDVTERCPDRINLPDVPPTMFRA